MSREQQITWVLRLATLAVGILLLIQGELVMACLMFLLTGGIEWVRREDSELIDD